MSSRKVCDGCNHILGEGDFLIESDKLILHPTWYPHTTVGTATCNDKDFCSITCLSDFVNRIFEEMEKA